MIADVLYEYIWSVETRHVCSRQRSGRVSQRIHHKLTLIMVARQHHADVIHFLQKLSALDFRNWRLTWERRSSYWDGALVSVEYMAILLCPTLYTNASIIVKYAHMQIIRLNTENEDTVWMNIYNFHFFSYCVYIVRQLTYLHLYDIGISGKIPSTIPWIYLSISMPYTFVPKHLHLY